jgi:salicylate 5-hydroxylase small subunit
MLKDRVYGIRETLFHGPYYQRYVVGCPVVRKSASDRFRFEREANHAVFRTKLTDTSTVFYVGRYVDVVVQTSEGLRFALRCASTTAR